MAIDPYQAPPMPTKAQWFKQRDPKKGWTYARFQRYFRKRYAPTTGPAAAAGGAYSGNPLQAPYLSDPQLQAQASGMIQSAYDPLIANITATYQRRAANAAAAIRGYTNEYVTDISGLPQQMAGIYGGAQSAEAAAAGALTQFLSGQGQQGEQALQGTLQQINAPAAAGQYAQNAAGLGQNIAGQAGARGYTSLSQLIAEGANQQAYAAKFPDIARARGAETLRQSTTQLNQALTGE